MVNNRVNLDPRESYLSCGENEYINSKPSVFSSSSNIVGFLFFKNKDLKGSHQTLDQVPYGKISPSQAFFSALTIKTMCRVEVNSFNKGDSRDTLDRHIRVRVTQCDRNHISPRRKERTVTMWCKLGDWYKEDQKGWTLQEHKDRNDWIWHFYGAAWMCTEPPRGLRIDELDGTCQDHGCACVNEGTLRLKSKKRLLRDIVIDDEDGRRLSKQPKPGHLWT